VRLRNQVLAAFAVSHLVVLAGAWAGAQLAAAGHLDHHPRYDGSLLDLLTWWDGRYYLAIAQDGYPGGDPETLHGFFPLVAGVFAVFGGHLLPALIVANVAGLAAIWGVAELARRYFDEEVAVRAAWLFALAPGAVTLGMTYTEPYVVAFATGAAIALMAGRPWLALALGVACGLTRVQGFLFALPLLAIAWRSPRRRLALAVACGPLVGLALFVAYLAWRTGDWLAYAHAQADNSPFRNRTSPGPNGLVVAVRLAYQNLTRDGIVPWELRDVGGAVGYGALLAVAAWRRLPWPWIAAGALAILIPVSAGTMAGASRYSLMALPAFWVLALLVRRPTIFVGLACGSAALLALNALWLPLHWP
jgi:Dolichyl-phosphate-mannose-protein mannosyltransferase